MREMRREVKSSPAVERRAGVFHGSPGGAGSVGAEQAGMFPAVPLPGWHLCSLMMEEEGMDIFLGKHK